MREELKFLYKLRVIDKVFLYYLDRNDSDEEVRDFYLSLKEKLDEK